MAIKTKWDTHPLFSPVSATAAVCSGYPLVDTKLNGLIGDSAAIIKDRLALADIPQERFWSHLISLGKKGKDDRSRVEMALNAAGSGELAADTLAPTIAGQLADIRIAYGEAYPKLAEQLLLRARPLQEQWEARGPGLMACIGRLTHRDLLPKSVTIALVQPALGGAGGVEPENRFAWIEAMLTNPHAEIPEVLRLGWLIARTGLGRKQSSKLVDSERLPELATLALLPIVTQAGQEVELVSELSMGQLFEAWRIRRVNSAEAAEQLSSWWAQMQSGDTPFPVGMKALDRILNH